MYYDYLCMGVPGHVGGHACVYWMYCITDVSVIVYIMHGMTD